MSFKVVDRVDSDKLNNVALIAKEIRIIKNTTFHFVLVKRGKVL